MKRLALAIFLTMACAACTNAQDVPESARHSEEAADRWILWKWANFAILAGAIGYIISKKLPPFFRSRTAGIQQAIADARQTKRDAEKRAAEMDQRLNALGAEIERFRTQARDEMEHEGARIRQETGKQIEKLQQQAEQEIESAGKTAHRELKSYAAQLAFELAEQRIRSRVDTDTETALVNDFVKDLQKQGSQN